MGDIAAVVVASELVEALFHGPQAGEGNLWLRRGLDFMQFVIVHHMAGYIGAVMVHCLDVDTDGMVTQGHGHGLVAVAQAEVDVMMSLQQRLAFVSISENGRLVDAVFLEQSMLQQAVGGQAQALVTLLPVAQGVFAPLGADCRQCLPQVEAVDMVVDVDQFLVTGFSLNSMCRPLCRAKMAAASMR